MLGPDINDSARVPLFERLIDPNPASSKEPRPLRSYNRPQLRESIRRELVRMLNTRCSIPEQLLWSREQTTIDYGIPDFAMVSPNSSRDRRHIAQVLQKIIPTLEPRLKDVRITVGEFVDEYKALWLRIEAMMVTESIREPVSFPVLVRKNNGEYQVHESD